MNRSKSTSKRLIKNHLIEMIKELELALKLSPYLGKKQNEEIRSQLEKLTATIVS